MDNTTMECYEGMSKYLSINGYEQKRYRFIADFFNGISGKILDVGCCKGGLRSYLPNGVKYYGVDGLDESFENYQKIDLNSKKLPYPDNHFDGVNCTAVLEHLFYPLEVLNEVKRVLKADGIVLVSLPNDKSLNSLFAQLFIELHSYEEAVYGHHWRFSLKTAREFFEKEFKIIREAPEFGPLFRKYLPFLKFRIFCTEWFMLGVKK